MHLSDHALHHGGGLIAAAAKYQIQQSDWLDLSTGVNPVSYPIPGIPASVWNRLPEDHDGLEQAAAGYYGSSCLLPIAGSQAAIMALPKILVDFLKLKKDTHNINVLLPEFGYKEHLKAWANGGFKLDFYYGQPEQHQIEQADVVLLINPNNPAGWSYSPQLLAKYHQQLKAKGGCLIVDEAFIDTTPEQSICQHAGEPGLIILRSLGKFFGLAGCRVGFIFGWPELLGALKSYLGPWSISGPARYIAKTALSDILWQHSNRQRLLLMSDHLQQVLQDCFSTEISGPALFKTVPLKNAPELHDQLCRQAILTRLTDERHAIRFGLPENKGQLQRLENTLQNQLL